MRIDDPSRPQIAFRPAYGTPAIAALPRLELWPMSSTTTMINIWLMIDSVTAHQFNRTVENSELPDLLTTYFNCPEEFFKETFGYNAPDKAHKPETPDKTTVPVFTLSNLLGD